MVSAAGSKFLKVVYTSKSIDVGTETGFVEDVGGKYYVANIPFLTENLNIDDEVILRFRRRKLPKVEEVISRKYYTRAAITYKNISDFRAICEKLRAKGCKVEGMQGPSLDPNTGSATDGSAVVAGNISESDLHDEIAFAGGSVLAYEDLTVF